MSNGQDGASSILVDTNIIVPEYRLEGARTRVLLRAIPSTSHTLYVPRVVIDEVASTMQRKITKLRDGFAERIEHPSNSAIRRNVRSLFQIPSDGAILREVDNYREWLIEKLVGSGARIVDYPKVDHADVVGRQTRGRRPFQPNRDDEGYRDTLVWESVIDIAHTVQGNVVFVSEDKGAFADGERLHPHLVSDLRFHGIDPARIRYCSQFVEFAKEYLSVFEVVETVRAKLSSAIYGNQPLAENVRSEIAISLSGYAFGNNELAISGGVTSGYIYEVLSVSDLVIEGVVKLASGEFMAQCASTARCALDIEFDVSGEPRHEMLRGAFLIRSTLILDEAGEDLRSVALTAVHYRHIVGDDSSPDVDHADKLRIAAFENSVVDIRDAFVQTLETLGAQIVVHKMDWGFRPSLNIAVIASWRTMRLVCTAWIIRDDYGYGLRENMAPAVRSLLLDSGIGTAVIVCNGGREPSQLGSGVWSVGESRFEAFVESLISGESSID